MYVNWNDCNCISSRGCSQLCNQGILQSSLSFYMHVSVFVSVACSFHHTPKSSCNITHCWWFKYIAHRREVKESNREHRVYGQMGLGAFILKFVLTCKYSTGLRCHVNLVLSGDAQHHGFGSPVVLGGQQPAQRFRKNPVEGEEKRDSKEKETKDEQSMLPKQERRKRGKKKTRRERDYCL